MSHFAELVFDDIETEQVSLAVDSPRRRALFDALSWWSIECVGDRFRHGVIYNRRTGTKVGGWACLPRIPVEEIL